MDYKIDTQIFKYQKVIIETQARLLKRTNKIERAIVEEKIRILKSVIKDLQNLKN